jgi:hypothetical protein
MKMIKSFGINKFFLDQEKKSKLLQIKQSEKFLNFMI